MDRDRFKEDSCGQQSDFVADFNLDNVLRSSEDESTEPVAKKIKTEWSKSYSNKAVQMMKKMGYENDKGLGKCSQGRLEPIIAVQQDGRRGLGLKLDNIRNSAEQWDPSCEHFHLPEELSWLCNSFSLSCSIDEINSWLRVGKRKESLEGETRFCNSQILHDLLEAKTVLDDLNESDLRRARSRCNPFETIRSSIFLNRAAVKMANIDSLCDYMFTNPLDQAGNSILKPNELLYFADICAGPGGFSEYILYRKSWEAKGFGFTLRGQNDFKLDKFFAASPESFDPFYGVKNDGDIFDEGNQNSLADYIFKHSATGVHFVMADGGFSVDGQENIQEILSKQLYLCQCLTALKILRVNGSFVCKLFDLFTPFSVGLIYLMYQAFEQISIVKPNSSRPANSERYLICKWKKSNSTQIVEYLNNINKILGEGANGDVTEIVSIEILYSDKSFMKYITDSNNYIGRNQIIALRKIAAFCQDPQLKEVRQADFRKQCLELWNLPDKLRQAPEIKPIDKTVEEILGDWSKEQAFLATPPVKLCSIESLQRNIESIYDWYFVAIGRNETSFNTSSIFLCRSKGNLLRYTESRKWESVENIFEIAPKSLFYGEIVYEFVGEGRTQTRISGLHIIDAIMLGGIDVRRLKLTERNKMCEKFTLSLNKPFKEGKYGSLRCKRLYKLTEINTFFNEMRCYTLKDNSSRLGFSLNKSNRFFVPGGLLMLCEICHTFFSNLSNSSKMLYYFNKLNHKSYYESAMPIDVQKMLYASFRNCFIRRLLWKWTTTEQVEKSCDKRELDLLYRDELDEFLLKRHTLK